MLVAVIERDNIIIPLNFEPIENVGIVYDKQDCEINAAKRMMKRIKQQLKRLPICISGDAPYFNEYYETTKKYGDIIIKEENEEIYEYYNDIQ